MFEFWKTLFAIPFRLIRLVAPRSRQDGPKRPFVLRVDPFADYRDGVVETAIPKPTVVAVPLEQLYIKRNGRHTAATPMTIRPGEQAYRRQAGNRVRYELKGA